MVEIIERKLISDDRGWLLKSITGKEEGLPPYTGEVYTVCGFPNKHRGGHYHRVATEWFSLIAGDAILKLKNIKSGEEQTLEISASNPITIVVPPFIAHKFECKSDKEFILLAYTDQYYDPADTLNWDL